MASKNLKTNAARLLDRAKIKYRLVPYEVDESNLAADHVAESLGEDIRQVFKTIVLHGERTGHFVCVLPGNREIDLKKAAKVAGDKKAELIAMKELLPLTGYIRGGCSPIGMKKPFPTFFHTTALDFDHIYVSAGVRGLQLEMAPSDLIGYVGAQVADICASDIDEGGGRGMNSFGELFRLTTFGESHGAAIGGVIDGMPAGMAIDTVAVQQELDRRRPGQSDIVTQRNESDRVEFLSGIYEGTSTGTPIGFIIRNADQRSNDYENMRHTWRPSHADMTYTLKYGHRDHRGGGRASARETAARVVAGALAKQILLKKGITVHAYTSRVGDIAVPLPYSALPLNDINSNPVRCPHAETANKMMELIRKVKGSGDTIGGTIQCVITGTPAGLGEPIFDKLQARLAAAMLSLPAAKGFDYGCGFDGCGELGSASIDELEPSPEGDRPRSVTNHSGGIQGGISNGEDIYFRVAFKPVATLLRPVQTVTDQLQSVTLQARGRHDPCVLPRAVPVVEAMAAMVIADALLLNQTTHLL